MIDCAVTALLVLENRIIKLFEMIGGWGISCEIALKRMSPDLTDGACSCTSISLKYFLKMQLQICQHCPAGTRRNNNAFITSKRRRRRRFDVMKTLSLRYYCVMCPLGGSSYDLAPTGQRTITCISAVQVHRGIYASSWTTFTNID